MAKLVGTIEPLSRTVPHRVTFGVIIAIESSQGYSMPGAVILKWCRSPWTTGVNPGGVARQLM